MSEIDSVDTCSALNHQILAGLYSAAVDVVAMPVADHREQLGELESQSVSRMIEKRLHEYSTGRFCAHQALQITMAISGEETESGDPLAALSSRASSYDIAIGPEREPCWPADVRGSISHTNDIAAAVVTKDPACRSLGLDIEPLQALEDDVLKIVADPDELTSAQRLLEQQLQVAQSAVGDMAGVTCSLSETAACIVFSAKESIFKCLFPVYRHWLDFREVRVLLKEMSVSKCDATCESPSPEPSALKPVAADNIECWRGHFQAELTGHCAAGIDMAQLQGQFAVLHGIVVTTAELSGA